MTVLAGWEAVEPRSDAELALAAAAGDRGAFACIYDRYAHRLHDFCIGMLGDREAAADCVQDAFCTAVTCLSDLREPDKLRSWLYAIVRSEALRRVRHNSREWTTDDVPEQASAEASPDTLAARMELADLIDAAAGGLSDRDRAVLELAFRQGLDGPELAVALGISLTNANTMVYRLRETIERSLGALLVSRRVRVNPTLCPQLAVILADWDGQFTVLVRKRVARHIESCVRCDRDRRRLVSPAALLGAAPVLIPAPAWLRRRTMDKVRLTCTEADLDIPHTHSPPRRGRPNSAGARYIHGAAHTRGAPNVAAGHRRRPALLAALLIGVPFVILGTTIAWFTLPQLSVAPINATSQMVTPRSTAAPPPPAPARSITRPPAPPMTRPQQSRTAVPTVVLPRETVTSTAAPAPAPSDTEPSSPPPSPAPIAPAPSLTITFAPPSAVAPPLQIPSLQIPSLPMPTIPMPTPRGAASTPAQQSAPPTTPAPNTADVPGPPAPAPTTSAVPVPVDPYPIIR